MTATLLDLLALDSHSKDEKAVADYLVPCLKDAGLETRIDGAGEAVGGNVGNVVGYAKGTLPDAAALLLCAHMDVVPPGQGVKPIVEAGRIRANGSTVLGGDDKTGVAAIVEVLRTLRERDLAHGPIEVAFTICEEIGLLGAKHLDYGAMRSREAIVLDSSFATQLVTRAPSSDRYVFSVHGLEAHAGLCPENGISAVRVAAEAISAMPLGRIDAQTTANVVIAAGPTATNVIPNLCVVRGEARSLDDGRLDEVMRSIRAAFGDAARKATATVSGRLQRAWIEEECHREYHSFLVNDDEPIVGLVRRAAQAQGAPIQSVTIGGGSDANVFNRQGITAVNLGSGMRDIHTVNEWVDLEDFYRAANIVLECVKERAAG